MEPGVSKTYGLKGYFYLHLLRVSKNALKRKPGGYPGSDSK